LEKNGCNALQELIFLHELTQIVYQFFSMAQKHANELSCQAFTGVHRELFKIFGAMSKDFYGKICKYFGIDKVEESTRVRQESYQQIFWVQ